MQRQDEDELELSAEALAALAEFAVEVRPPSAAQPTERHNPMTLPSNPSNSH